MVRISKQAERRSKNPRKTRVGSAKASKVKQATVAVVLKSHANALEGAAAQQAFIPKIR